MIWKNLIYYVFLIPGFFFGTFCVGKKILSHLFVPALAFFLFLGIYIGGSELPYYALPLAVFTVLGFALIGWIFEALEKHFIKPEKEIYLHLCERYSLNLSECLFTDDRMVNVEGAKLIGMEAVLFTTVSNYVKDLQLFCNNEISISRND